MIFWRGETKPMRLKLTDEDGVDLDIAGWQEFRVALGVGVDVVAVKEWGVVAPSTGDVTVNASPPYVEVELSQSESNLLAPAAHFMDVFMKMDGDWIHCLELVPVDVREPVVAVPSP